MTEPDKRERIVRNDEGIDGEQQGVLITASDIMLAARCLKYCMVRGQLCGPPRLLNVLGSAEGGAELLAKLAKSRMQQEMRTRSKMRWRSC